MSARCPLLPQKRTSAESLLILECKKRLAERNSQHRVGLLVSAVSTPSPHPPSWRRPFGGGLLSSPMVAPFHFDYPCMGEDYR
jgi:hypothetical protein